VQRLRKRPIDTGIREGNIKVAAAAGACMTTTAIVRFVELDTCTLINHGKQHGCMFDVFCIYPSSSFLTVLTCEVFFVGKNCYANIGH
jgi:hypothetical protein